MQQIVLISANQETIPVAVYPVGIARLAWALEQEGHDVIQLDMLVDGEEKVLSYLQHNHVDMVGLSLRNIDNTNSEQTRSYVSYYIRLVNSIKSVTNAPVILGGSGFSLFAEQIVDNSKADYGIIGPGEDAVCQLMDQSRDSTASDRIITVDTSKPQVAWRGSHDARIVNYYWHKGGMIGIQTKRGCPKKCNYCTYPLIDGRCVQNAPIQQIVDEMEKLYRDHNIDYFFMVDSIFNITPQHEIAVAEELIRRKLKIRWGAFFSPVRIHSDYLKTLKCSGLEHMEFGTDSLCDYMLKIYQKDFTVDEIINVSRLCEKHNVFYAHYLIFGGPGETTDTLRQSLENSGHIKRTVFFPFVGVRIYPGTDLYEIARKEGLVENVVDCLEPVFYLSDKITPENIWQLVARQIDNARQWFFPHRYELVKPFMQKMRQKGVKGPLWEYLVVNA